MNAVNLYIHSFVDLITNSSSETFLTATEESVQIIKDVINVFLTGLGTADDYFVVELVYSERDAEDNLVEKVGLSEYKPSRLRISIKPMYEESPKLKELEKVLLCTKNLLN